MAREPRSGKCNYETLGFTKCSSVFEKLFFTNCGGLLQYASIWTKGGSNPNIRSWQLKLLPQTHSNALVNGSSCVVVDVSQEVPDEGEATKAFIN